MHCSLLTGPCVPSSGYAIRHCPWHLTANKVIAIVETMRRPGGYPRCARVPHTGVSDAAVRVEAPTRPIPTARNLSAPGSAKETRRLHGRDRLTLFGPRSWMGKGAGVSKLGKAFPLSLPRSPPSRAPLVGVALRLPEHLRRFVVGCTRMRGRVACIFCCRYLRRWKLPPTRFRKTEKVLILEAASLVPVNVLSLFS